ncbi:hypothetical protein FRC09_015903, partial [Ceratobasidium sp. 395]
LGGAVVARDSNGVAKASDADENARKTVENNMATIGLLEKAEKSAVIRVAAYLQALHRMLIYLSIVLRGAPGKTEGVRRMTKILRGWVQDHQFVGQISAKSRCRV